jgi:tRNA G10  N-methylase Trm11
MTDLFSSFISKTFLHSVWALDYEAFKDSEEEGTLAKRLRRWADRKDLRETSAEAALIEEFFHNTWSYNQAGQPGTAAGGFTLWPKFPVPAAGERGGTGEADAALGVFRKDVTTPVPQVLCEFKDIRSDLDAPQRRKGNNRSPVRQCLDYLGFARRGLFPSDPVLPTWGIVTDMNEFRLYWFDKGHHQSIRFVIRATSLLQGTSLVAESEAARLDRFLFYKVFHRDSLISSTGRSALLGLIDRQHFHDRQLENTFYDEYRKFRERLYLELLIKNGPGTSRFPGTNGRLVRLAQKILDRCIFIFFCEDMGQTLAFPPKLFQEFLIDRSKDPYFDADATNIWQDIIRLFTAMNEGRAFGGKLINAFNGGLFARDADLERLLVPNSVFCQHLQGTNQASLYSYKQTLLYLCASYNYASDLGGVEIGRALGRDPSKSLGLYTLGRIFEQSITELEILEAEAEGRPSVNKLSKRKRDGVYYTPEWVVERIVDETLAPRFADIKRECGWPASGDPPLAAVDNYAARLRTFTVLDPACGSGAFLITALRALLAEWRAVQAVRRDLVRKLAAGGILVRREEDDAALIADILRMNIYGVDINAASVEIAQLALWLHTARGDRPLSSLGDTIREGNSLIGPDFYKGQINLALYNESERERVNAFDWVTGFPEVFDRGGFDAVVGNPPYVKLQNFRPPHEDMARFLRDGRPESRVRPYASTQTGNFDLYLPFIEKGISLLNEHGRLGFIAPSLWTTNEYGKALREFIAHGRHLDRWIDFKAYQVFQEATNYTALQFFTKHPSKSIRVVQAPTGEIPEHPWDDARRSLPYGRQIFGERWLLSTGPERALIDRLYQRCRRLDAPEHTSHIFVGIQTSADAVYHLKQLGPGRYLCTPHGDKAGPPYEVALEDGLMKPLVSGAEAKRYVRPATDTYLLFPYSVCDGRVDLIDASTMKSHYPKTWAYLLSYEKLLRARENGRMDNNSNWWAYNYPKNLDKQEMPKIVVPRLVSDLVCSVDDAGTIYLDNVDVGGVAIAKGENPFFIAGILNSPVANFVFRRISKPFRGGYLSANKQYIAPLPIPPASDQDRDAVAASARALQSAHTARRDTLARIARRLSATRQRNAPATWLFAGLEGGRNSLPPCSHFTSRSTSYSRHFFG